MKIKALKNLCLIFTLISSPAFAGFVVDHGNSRPSDSGRSGSNSVDGGVVERREEISINIVAPVSCNKSPTFASYELVRNLMPFPDSFKVEVISKKTIEGGDKTRLGMLVSIPSYYGSCVKFSIRPEKIGKGRVHFRAKMLSAGDSDDLPTKGAEITYAQYESCLIKKGILIKGSGGARDQYTAKPEDLTKSQHYDFNIDVKAGSSLKMAFDSPEDKRNRGDSEVFSLDNSARSPQCFATEDFKKGGLVLHKSKGRKAAEAAAEACESADYRKILDELKKLRSVGNANELSGYAKILEAVLSANLISAREKREEQIFEEMGDVSEYFRALKKDGYPEDDERVAKKSAREYLKLIEELKEISISPSIARIKSLLEERRNGASGGRKDEIDKEIEELNDIIGRLSKESQKELRSVMNGLQEYAFVNIAINVRGFQLMSEAYSKVSGNPRSRGRLTLKRAKKSVERALEKFEKRKARDWEDVYFGKRGDSKALDRTGKEYTTALKRFKKDEATYRKKEQKSFEKACLNKGFTFRDKRRSKKCRNYSNSRAGRLKKYLNIREKQLRYISGRKKKYEDIDNFFTQFNERAASDGGGEDEFGFYSYGSSYDGYDDDFSLGLPVDPRAHNRGPATSGVNTGQMRNGFPLMGPMMGPNPYSQVPHLRGVQQRQFYPQQNYW